MKKDTKHELKKNSPCWFLRIWRTNCFKVTCTPNFFYFTYSGNWKSMFMSVLVKKYSSTAICAIYDFEYVTDACMQFVKAWHRTLVEKRPFFDNFWHTCWCTDQILDKKQYSSSTISTTNVRNSRCAIKVS